MAIKTQINGETITFLMAGEVQKSVIEELETMILDYIANDNKDFLVDIKDVPYLDSLNLAGFLKIKKMVQNEDIHFKLINPTDNVRLLIETASLEPYLLEDEEY